MKLTCFFFRFHETDLSYIKSRRQAIQIDLYNTTEKYENQRQKTCQSECRQKPQIMTTSSVLKLTSVKKVVKDGLSNIASKIDLK